MHGTPSASSEQPFRSTPDTACYYPATGHERCLAGLLQGLLDDEGLLLLHGAPGTGKTLLLHRLVEQLDESWVVVFLTQGHFADRSSLFQAILYDLQLPHEGMNEQELRLRLTDALLANFGAGKRTLLLLDEAQHLTAELLEELRLLGNLEARAGKAVHVLLSAQPSILDTLVYPGLEVLRQRLIVRLALEPLEVHEAADYLLHRLRLGRNEDALTDEAIEVLARGCRGIPRWLNQAGQQALRFATEAGVDQVDAEAALEALLQLGLDTDEAMANDDERQSA